MGFGIRATEGRCRRWPLATAAAVLGFSTALVMLAAAALAPAAAIEKAEAAKGPPLHVALFVSSRNDACFDPGNVAAITRLAKREADRINAQGGVAGRPIALRFLDDARNDKAVVDNVRSALTDPSMLAMIGLTSSNRAKLVFDALGPDLKARGIPFLSDISVSKIFADHKNIFSTRASQDEVRAPVMAEFTRRIGYVRPAFVGLGTAVFSTALGDALKKLHGDNGLVADIRLPGENGKVAPEAIAAAVTELAKANPDIVYLGVGNSTAVAVIPAIAASGAAPALFVTGRIDALPPELTKAYPNAIYQLATEDLPEVSNNRIRRLIATENPADWIFEGARNASAPGWAKGECKPRPADLEPDPLDAANLRAISQGSRYADMIGLVASAARRAERGTSLSGMRSEIVSRIGTDFAAGRGAFKGAFENWAFDTDSRTAVRMPFVVILPKGLGRTQLAPIQFLRARDGSLRSTTTLYADIDLIRAHRVDDNEKTFFAEFYLSLRANASADLDKIEFANAYIDPSSANRQITIEPVHRGGKSDAYPESMKIYKVSGRFLFDPELADYPLDKQLFTINIQPKSGDAPFIVQPPPLNLRDQRVATDGWDQITQYVGTDEDFVPVVDAFTHEPSIVPFYKASFAWLMKRQTTDYVLRVVVPLGFILIVAYLSIFIPKANFEAIVTIQVTALLSAVALYLSLPKIDSDSATLSDRMFVFDYMMVAIMIVISILRVNPIAASNKWVVIALDVIHVVVIPLLVLLAGLYVYGLSVAAR